MTAKEVKDVLIKTADKIGNPAEYVNGHSLKYGYGRVNADKAVAEAARRKDIGNVEPDVEEDVATGRGLFRFSVKRQASEGFGVQIGAFAEYGNVLIQAEKLDKLFNAPIIVNINELNGRTVYKIVVGAFDSRSEARALHRTMRTKGVEGFIRNLADMR